MSLSLDNAVVYDEESFPNVYTIDIQNLFSGEWWCYEISDFRDDRIQLIQHIKYLQSIQAPMIGYNNLGYDYAVLHFLMRNSSATAQQIYAFSDGIIRSRDRFAGSVRLSDRLVPQIDLMKVHHFDNDAKRTSLKALQINMRWPNVLESRIPFGTVLTEEQVWTDIRPYNRNDTASTAHFAHISLDEIKFRNELVDKFGVDVLNWNSTKIGEEMLIDRLGESVCYSWVNGRKQKRQTIRNTIPVKDMIFPYITFRHPELIAVHQFMSGVTLTPDDMQKETARKKESPLSKKIEFGGIEFAFGSGGAHASVRKQRFVAGNGYVVRDVDVAGMYPAISNVNKLAPEHLGQVFVDVYAVLPEERAKFKKGTMENGLFKLAGNAAWGKSKSLYSCFYDPKYALTVPVNGQLMICMLADYLIDVPTLQFIQVNTDGLTYYVHEDYLPLCKQIEEWWQSYTLLVLEDVAYSRMFVRDVNNYIAEDVKGKRKLKGAYWYPDSSDYETYLKDISGAGVWHKDFNPIIVPKAAVAYMLDGIDPVTTLMSCRDPYDFVCRERVTGVDELYIDGIKTQKTTRYYVSHNGGRMTKVSPPPKGFDDSMYKKKNGITNDQYHAVMREVGYQWDARVCAKSETKYSERTTNIQSGWKVKECNNIADFDFADVDYNFYLSEIKKLII